MRHFSRREFIVESSAGVVALAAGGIVGFGDKAIAATTKSSFPGLGLPPFLGKPKTTEISINLVAAEKPLRGFLEYRPLDHAGTSYNATDEILLEPFSPKEIVVGDLKPGTDYEYRLNVSDATDGMNKE